MTVEFVVPGKPEGKGRPRFAARGKFVQTYTPDKTVVYENWVRECWRAAHAPKLNGEIWAFITAYFPVPKSATKKAKAAMLDGSVSYGKKPDADNLAKCILDALNSLAYDDDSQITLLHVEKVYSEEPRVKVRLVEHERQE